MKLIFTGAKDILPLLLKELQQLEKSGTTFLNPPELTAGYVRAEVDERNFYRLHLQTSLADEIHLLLKEFSAKTPQMIFDQTRRIKWPDWVRPSSSIKIQLVNEMVDAPIVFKKLQEGIRDSMKHYAQKVAKFDSKGDVCVLAYMDRNHRLSLSINTSGRSLHKRGYRLSPSEAKELDLPLHPATLKENLAAALLQFAGYDGSLPLLDAFSGSGTIVIEAAYRALGKATHIHRAKGQFAFEDLSFFKGALYRQVQEELRREREGELDHPILGMDIDAKNIQLAKTSALKARVEKFIHWKVQDFFQISEKPYPQGILISNLPYNQRLSVEDMQQFYDHLGLHLKKVFSNWKVYLLVDASTDWNKIPLRVSRKLTITNGGIECRCLEFEIFGGIK